MHARVVLWVGKGVLFREVSSVQECPHRESGFTAVHTVCTVMTISIMGATLHMQSTISVYG